MRVRTAHPWKYRLGEQCRAGRTLPERWKPCGRWGSSKCRDQSRFVSLSYVEARGTSKGEALVGADSYRRGSNGADNNVAIAADPVAMDKRTRPQNRAAFARHAAFFSISAFH